jgi:apolipoprotein N-acyltransferase
MELIRENFPVLGFTWGRLAFSQSSSPVGGFASWSGAVGVTFVVAVTGALLAQAARAGTWPRTFISAASAILLVAVVGIVPGLALPSTGSTRIALIQGGTPQTGLGDRDVRREVLASHAAVTRDLGADIDAGRIRPPDLVLWPENSVDFDPFQDVQAARTIQVAADAVGAPILVGVVMDFPEDPTLRANVAILWLPTTGPEQIYIKQRLVPFGEFIPLRSLIAARIDRLDRVRRDFSPGDTPGLFSVGDAVVGSVICFEVAYDAAIAEVVAGGADILTVQTNNATWAGMNQINQQLAIERLRARETGRSVGVAATTGATVALDPRGEEIASLPLDDVGYVVANLPRVQVRTPGSLLGPSFTYAAIALTVIGLVLTWTPWSRRPLTKVNQ